MGEAYDDRITPLDLLKIEMPFMKPLLGQLLFYSAIKLNGDLVNFGTGVEVAGRKILFVGFLVLKTTSWVSFFLFFMCLLSMERGEL